MAKVLISILLFLGLATLALSQQCNSTHLEYFSEYYLGRQDELNKTFIKIQEKVSTLNDVTWKANDTATYKIAGVKPTFYYLDSQQRAVIKGNDTVVIEGGRVDVTLNFEWARIGLGTISGTGTAKALSDPIIFAMQLVIKDGYMLETLLVYENVTFSNFGINITRIEPASTSQEDLKNLKRLLNDILNVTTVRHELEDEIEKYFYYYLSQSLYDDRRIIDEYYEYVWTGSKGKFVIPLSINATGVDIEPLGITLTYVSKIKNYTNWTCEHEAPVLPLNPQVYGGIQEFITYDVYKNVLKYAIDNGQLDVDLNRRDWESRFFQFYAGDLYEVIPKVAQKFLASEVVTGSCKTSSRNADIKKGGHDSLNVSLIYDCEIGITRDKVGEFQLALVLTVEGIANETALNFQVVGIHHTATISSYMDYKIGNIVLAHHMIAHSLNRILHHHVFGSGWKLYTRDYPHFIAEDNYTIVYDSTHVDPGTPKHMDMF